MRRIFLRSAAVVMLAAMFSGHVTELFDRWDHTFRTGQDSDFAVVAIAAFAGIAFVATKVGHFVHLARVGLQSSEPMKLLTSAAAGFVEVFAVDLSPPCLGTTPIRI